jgi:hypothetical protein
MKKSLILFTFAAFAAAQSFAAYIVVLKDGTRYKAKAKWTVQNGKASIVLENGQVLQLDPSLIDAAKSEQVTKIGMSGANVISDPTVLAQEAPQRNQQPSLGSQIRLRRQPGATPAPATPAPATSAPAPSITPVTTTPGEISSEVVEKFQRAFENVGIFEQKVVATGGRSLRADLTADSEDKVFNAISATSFLIVRNAGVTGAQIDMVELFMRTTNGGAAGRFQMSRADAEALDQKRITQQDYFVRKVLY